MPSYEHILTEQKKEKCPFLEINFESLYICTVFAFIGTWSQMVQDIYFSWSRSFLLYILLNIIMITWAIKYITCTECFQFLLFVWLMKPFLNGWVCKYTRVVWLAPSGSLKLAMKRQKSKQQNSRNANIDISAISGPRCDFFPFIISIFFCIG